MTVSRDFSELNVLRPQGARFGEVVSIALYAPEGAFFANELPFPSYDSLVGHSKRKSIHVPPSSNAYWNFTNLHSDLVTWCNTKGVCRENRIVLQSLLNRTVRWIHLYEVEATYSPGGRDLHCIQYFNALIGRDSGGHFVSIWNAPMETSTPHSHLHTVR